MNEQKKSYIPVNCGDIVIASLPCGEGSVQGGTRPCIVLGNIKALKKQPGMSGYSADKQAKTLHTAAR